LFLLCASVLILSSFERKSWMEGELVMQLGASNATAPARHLRTTRKLPSAEERLKELGIQLPSPPQPFGTCAEAVRTGNLLFLSGMLSTEGHSAKFVGRAGAEFDVETGRQAARLAALNALAVAREYLGSLDRITRIVRLGVSLATTEDCREHPKIADGASDLLQDVFGKDKNPSRLINGVASLPLGTPVALELIFEVA
jgi:enamine deaminase RidA (YjgF/YER057c/UK114 family)